MITEIIQNNEIIYSFDETVDEKIYESKLKEIENNSTVKSIEFIFNEGITMTVASNLITNVNDSEIQTLKLTLND